MNLIIEANREGYAIDQIRRTMTVGDLIAMLEQYDEDTPVYLGHDRQSYGFYTYGGITEGCFNEDEETWCIVMDGEVIFTGTEEESAGKEAVTSALSLLGADITSDLTPQAAPMKRRRLFHV